MGDIVYLTKQSIQAVNDITTFDIEVPQWEGYVKAKTPTFRESSAIRKSCTEMQVDPRTGEMSAQFDQDKFMLYLVLFCVVDEAGNKMFGKQDVEWLETQKNGGAIYRIAGAIARQSGVFDLQMDIKKSESEIEG